MFSEYDDNLLSQGILHFKCGEYNLARRYLERALGVANDIETRQKANFYLSQIENDPALKRKYLQEVLASDPMHPEARRALAILDGKLKPEEIVNPENLPAAPGGTLAARADRFTCPTCGGRMAFAPDGQTLACDFCNSRQGLKPQLAGEQDFLLAMATAKGHLHSEAMHAFHCKGCGADFVLAPEALSATCAYCNSTHVVNLNERRELIPPQAILPFAFDQQQAERFLLGWLRQKSLRPARRPEPPRGLYVPVWTFDLFGQIPWSYQTQNDRGSYEIERGQETFHYDDVPVAASRRLPDYFAELLTSYSLSSLAVYDPRYLADWPAQAYEISMADASLEARAFAVRQAREQARTLVDAPLRHVTNFQSGAPKMSVASYKLALVSVWLAAYELSDGNSHQVMMNSQTGQVFVQRSKPNRVIDWLT